MLKLAWVLFGGLTASLWAADFYSARPHINDLRQSKESDWAIASTSLLQAQLDFVIELRVLYPQRQRVYLGRDGESLYDMDWILWRESEDRDSQIEPKLINISRDSSGSAQLYDYLRATKVHPMSVLVDTGYEGSVIEAINQVLKAHHLKSLPAHLISSAHPKSPSSRVSNQAYFKGRWKRKLFGSDQKEKFLDFVDEQIEETEGLPHFTQTASELQLNPDTGLIDAYSPEEIDPKERKKSVRLQHQIMNFLMGDNHQVDRLNTIQALLSPVLSGLASGRLDPKAVEVAHEGLLTQSFNLFWWDLREVFGKGGIDLNPAAMARLWELLPGGKPVLFDLEPDELKDFLKRETKQYQKAILRPWIAEIMDFHQAQQKPEKVQSQTAILKKLRKEIRSGWITVNGEGLKIRKKLDEGVRAEVFDLGDGLILKVPFEADDMRYIVVEAMVAERLAAEASSYGIKTLPTIAVGEEGSFLIRRQLPAESLGQNVSKSPLNTEQLSQLKNIFESTRRFAEDTGVGLDIKYDNLAWEDGGWILFDAGPRTTFGPYAFSLDIPDFETFYKLWKQDAPRKNGIKVSDFIQTWSRSRDCRGNFRDLKQ